MEALANAEDVGNEVDVASEEKSAMSIDMDTPEKYFVPRPKHISTFHYGCERNKSCLIEFEGVTMTNGSLFVECLSGVGTTSSVVGAYIVGELELPLVAVFHSPEVCGMSPLPSLPPFFSRKARS